MTPADTSPAADVLAASLAEERRLAGLFYPVGRRIFVDGERIAAVDASRGAVVDARGYRVVALAEVGPLLVVGRET